jgi:glutamate/tyrosine decarboxylase-like PLP-dependent enzyme/GNAT superfamily N-acetyltransferase
MNRSHLPSSAFVDPRGNNRAEIESLIQQFISLLLPYLTEATQRPPLPQVSLTEPVIAETPVAVEDILEELRPLIAGAMNAAHPGYIGHMNSIPTTLSIVGDLIAAALSNNMLFHELSPTFTPLELTLMKQFAQLFGLGEKSGGVLLGSGTMANLQALAVARNVMCGVFDRGLSGVEAPPVILASEVAHASIVKAAMILGLGRASVMSVGTNAGSRMDPDSLRAAIRKAREEERNPFCVVATAGTTVTGSIDPLIDIGRIAKEHGLWFHVDAAYGGALIFSEKHKRRLAGIEHADSITFNPHKWLFVSSGCAMALFRNMELMEEAFRIPAPYSNNAGAVTNLGEITVHGSRRVEVLKLWLSLQHIGKRGYRQLVDEACALTEYFVAKIRERPFLQLAGNPDTNILCFRGTSDDWNASLQTHLLRDRNVFFSLPPYRGVRWLRAVLLNPFTDERLVDELFEDIDRFAVSTRRERDIQIRLATAADAEAIAFVLSNSFVEYQPRYTAEGFTATVLTPRQVEARIAEGPVWVAFENGVCVGTVSVVLKPEGLYIRGMAVDPVARGKGIGRKLLDCAEKFAVQNGCERLFLNTTPFLSRAIKLYEGYGFERSSARPDNLFGTPLFTMTRSLATAR